MLSLNEMYNSYKSWVSKNPQSLGDWETTAKFVSYFIAGRVNNSQVVSELIYCLSNLLVFYNDNIIKDSYKAGTSISSADKIKLWLTVVEYSEVFCELSAKKLWGRTGKWLIIISIQVFKCISRLLLIYRYKESIIQSPPIPVLDRRQIKNGSLSTINDVATQYESASFTLKRSGRIVRKVDASPPLKLRSWKPLECINNLSCENDQNLEKELESRYRLAEVIYIAKPLVHLASMACFGTQTWKPWMVSLAMDISSLQLYHYSKKNKLRMLTPQQRLQLSRRTVILVLYLIRSPFYEKHSKNRINSLLLALSKHLPLVGLICTPLAQYLPFWQSTYFYMWST